MSVNPLTTVEKVADAVGKVADVVKQRSDQLNTPDQRSNEEAAQVAADRDKIRKDIARGDQDELAKDMSP